MPNSLAAPGTRTNSPSLSIAGMLSIPNFPITSPPSRYPCSSSSSSFPLSVPLTNLSSAKKVAAVAPSCMSVPSLPPRLPIKPLARPPAPLMPSFLSSIRDAAPNLIAPLIINELSLPTALPNFVPNIKYKVNNLGPKSEKNLVRDSIFFLFFESVKKSNNLTKNFPSTNPKNAWIIPSMILLTGAKIVVVIFLSFSYLFSTRFSSSLLLVFSAFFLLNSSSCFSIFASALRVSRIASRFLSITA